MRVRGFMGGALPTCRRAYGGVPSWRSAGVPSGRASCPCPRAAAAQTPRTIATIASTAGTSTMLNTRSSVSSREMSRFRSYCTARNCCRVSTMSLRAASIAARCSGVITALRAGLLAAARSLAQRAQLLLGVVQMLLQRLLGLAEFRLRLALHLVHQDERMVGVAARAQPDQRVAAGERADQVGDERAVVAERHRGLLAEEVADAHPEAVGQDVAVGDHHQVGRAVGLRLVGRESSPAASGPWPVPAAR